MNAYRNCINGECAQHGGNDVVEVLNPATQKLIGLVPDKACEQFRASANAPIATGPAAKAVPP